MARAFRCAEHPRALLITFDNPIQSAHEIVISLIRDKTVWLLPSVFIGDNTFLIENSSFMFEQIVTQSTENLFLGFSQNNALVPESIEILSFHNSFFINYCDLSRHVDTISGEIRHDFRNPIAIFTHVGNDISLLQNWEQYYADIVEPRSLYVLDDGTALELSNFLSQEVNIVKVPQGPSDGRRLAHFCSSFQRFLLSQYRVVVHSGVDERLIHPEGLKKYLHNMAGSGEPNIIRTAQAFDLVHDPLSEPEIDLRQNLSLQRKHVIPNERHQKLAVTSTHATWGVGFTTVLEQPLVIDDEQLCLVQLSEMDLSLALARDRESDVCASDETAVNLAERKEQIVARLKDSRLTFLPDWMRGRF